MLSFTSPAVAPPAALGSIPAVLSAAVSARVSAVPHAVVITRNATTEKTLSMDISRKEEG